MRLARATPMYLRQLDSSTFENRALLSWPLKARRGAQPAGSTAHLLVRIELPEGARAASATRAQSTGPQALCVHRCLRRCSLPHVCLGGTSQRGYRPVCTELLEVNVPTSAIKRG